MANLNDERFRQMQDEMSRFEEEIGLPLPDSGGLRFAQFAPPHHPSIIEGKPKLISSHTFSEHSHGLIPPSFIPHQVRAPPGPSDMCMDPYGNSFRNPGPLPSDPFGGFPSRPGYLPPSMAAPQPEKPSPVVVSAAPTLYVQPEPIKEPEVMLPPPAPLPEPEEKRPSFLGKMFAAKKEEKLLTGSALSNIALYGNPRKKDKKNRKSIRTAGGQSWEDSTLLEWEDDDFRLFCGDLGNDVTDEVLSRAFSKYPSFVKSKVIRDKRTNKTKGYGFVSFKDPQDFIRASKEMNGRYVGSRPIKLRKSTWRNRSLDLVRKKDKEKASLIAILTGR